MADKTLLGTDSFTKLKKPSMYKVILLNDDYTTMDFVVTVLVEIFHKSTKEATKIMMDVHKKGRGIVGIYTYDIAITKIMELKKMAESEGYPLEAILEEA